MVVLAVKSGLFFITVMVVVNALYMKKTEK